MKRLTSRTMMKKIGESNWFEKSNKLNDEKTDQWNFTKIRGTWRNINDYVNVCWVYW